MGLFSRKREPSIGELLRPSEVPQAQQEQRMEVRSAKEMGAEARHQAAESIRGALSRLGESGRNLWKGLGRIWGTGKEKGVDAMDVAIGSTIKGGRAMGRGIERGAAVVANTPDWLMEKVGEGVYGAAEGAKAGGRFAKEQLVEGARWTGARLDQTKGWTEAKYNSLEQWAGGKVTAIQEIAGRAKDSFFGRVEQVIKWKEAAVVAYRESVRQKEKAALQLELDAMGTRKTVIEKRLAELEGISALRTELEPAGA